MVNPKTMALASSEMLAEISAILADAKPLSSAYKAQLRDAIMTGPFVNVDVHSVGDAIAGGAYLASVLWDGRDADKLVAVKGGRVSFYLDQIHQYFADMKPETAIQFLELPIDPQFGAGPHAVNAVGTLVLIGLACAQAGLLPIGGMPDDVVAPVTADEVERMLYALAEDGFDGFEDETEN